VVVLVGGSAFVCESWDKAVPALVMAWYGGAEGGHALAEVLLGEASPSGRLPCTWPVREEQLPPFSRRATEFAYGPLHGYRLFHARNEQPAYWFGHGLSYAPITWDAPVLHEDSSGTFVEVVLHNTASFPQREVVQVYLDLALGSHAEALPALAGFVSAEIPGGETQLARVKIDEALHRRVSGDACIRAGRSAGELIPVVRRS
jgi:beta-glucosidase